MVLVVVHDTPMTGKGLEAAYDPGYNAQMPAEPGRLAEGKVNDHK